MAKNNDCFVNSTMSRSGARPFGPAPNANTIDGFTPLASGIWSMVSVSWDAASVSFHVNGGAITKTINTPAGWVAPGPAADPALRLGPGAGAGGSSFDEVAVFAGKLSKTQIAAHYAATLLPTILSPPILSPLTGVREGDTLTLTPATYSGPSPGSSLKWQRCDADAGCSPIAGVVDTTYTLAAADVDSSLQVEETATNANGSIEPPWV